MYLRVSSQCLSEFRKHQRSHAAVINQQPGLMNQFSFPATFRIRFVLVAVFCQDHISFFLRKNTNLICSIYFKSADYWLTLSLDHSDKLPSFSSSFLPWSTIYHQRNFVRTCFLRLLLSISSLLISCHSSFRSCFPLSLHSRSHRTFAFWHFPTLFNS